jgi:ATP-dependent Clp protease ATP-binding subunit ClpC
VRIILRAQKGPDSEGQNVKHGLSLSLNSVIEQSVMVAHKFRHSNIGTEHLLYSLVSTGKNAATTILESMQINPEDLKVHIEDMFGQISTFRQQNKNLESSLESFFQGLQGALAGMQGTQQGESEGLRRKKAEGKSKTPVLDYFTEDMTKRAQDGKYDPIIGRDAEIERLVHILNRKTKNNPVLIGESGVGKTAIVEGLAQRITAGTVPPSLKGKRVLQLNMGSVIAGTKYRGEFEQRFDDIIKEASESDGEIILFIDEIHTVVGSGSAEGSLDAANILKPALSRSLLQVIGASTTDEYRKTIEKDRALERRFQSIMVEEPSIPDAIKILSGLKKTFEQFHRLTITDAAIEAAVKLSKRYLTERHLPDKAIDVLDEAAAGKSIHHKDDHSPRIKEIEKALLTLEKKKEDAVRDQKYQHALSLRKEEDELSEEMKKLKSLADGDMRSPIEIGEDDIHAIIARMTGIPMTRLMKSETKRLNALESVLKKSVVGQDDAIQKVARAVRRSRVGIGDSRRPIGSFLFLGPTGVGKTELVKTLASEIFQRDDALIKIDMSEFMERHNVSRLVGTTAGYVGYEEGGQLTEAVRRKPYSVVLFDEIEKAHPEFWNVLLQIMEDGKLTDGQGKVVDFRNTIIVMTSNIGADKLTKEAAKIGFKLDAEAERAERDYDEKRQEVLRELKDNFRPEFLNRIDHIIVFNALSHESIRKIVSIHIERLAERMQSQGYTMTATEAALDVIANVGFDPEYGARPIRRVIQDKIEDEVAEHILKGMFTKGDSIRIDAKGKDDIVLLHAETKSKKVQKKAKKEAVA